MVESESGAGQLLTRMLSKATGSSSKPQKPVARGFFWTKDGTAQRSRRTQTKTPPTGEKLS